MCIRDSRSKAIIATTFGKKPLSEGLHMNGAHIDSPRLDLKPNPLYEKEDIAYFKTHYYGGIRKYQWGTIPVSYTHLLLLRFVWECVKMASNRIYVNAKDKLQQGDKTTYGKTENKDRSQK